MFKTWPTKSKHRLGFNLSLNCFREEIRGFPHRTLSHFNVL